MKRINKVVILGLALFVFACGGIRYSQVDPAAKDFHPQRLAVLPVDVGTYEEARGVIDMVLAGAVVGKKQFREVYAGDTLKSMLSANDELRKAVMDYMVKLKTVNYSDPELSRKIGMITKADAILIANIDYWLYTKEGDKKVAKVGLGMKLVEVETGKIMWRAGHFEDESYSFFKPDLKDVARKVIDKMLSEMPH
ncbi:MAG: hypothetical protein N2317_01265 [Syntrophales bacterium]|nr:hypothetical protein [Syntrophales bacterium]